MAILGCQKEETLETPQPSPINNPNTNPNLSGLIKSLNINGIDNYFEVEYDTNKRPIKFRMKEFIDGVFTGRVIDFQITYNSNIVTVTYQDISETFTIGDSGRIISSSSGRQYSYNANGYLQEISENGEIRATYNWNNDGDLISKRSNLDNVNDGFRTFTYTYNSEKKENRKQAYSYADSGGYGVFLLGFTTDFFGKSPTHLLTQTLYEGGSSWYYSYEFDANGRISKQISDNREGTVDYFAYTYY